MAFSTLSETCSMSRDSAVQQPGAQLGAQSLTPDGRVDADAQLGRPLVDEPVGGVGRREVPQPGHAPTLAVGVLDDHAEVARLRPALGVVGQLRVGSQLLGVNAGRAGSQLAACMSMARTRSASPASATR